MFLYITVQEQGTYIYSKEETAKTSKNMKNQRGDIISLRHIKINFEGNDLPYT